MNTQLTFISEDKKQSKLWVNKEDWDMRMNFKRFQELKWWGNISQDMTYEEYVAQQQPKCSSNE